MRRGKHPTLEGTAESRWSDHYRDCAWCRSERGEGTLPELIPGLCPLGQLLAQAALEEVRVTTWPGR